MSDKIIYLGKVAGGFTGIGAFVFGLYVVAIAPLIARDELSTTFRQNEFRLPDRFETEFVPRLIDSSDDEVADEPKAASDDPAKTIIDARDAGIAEEFRYSKLDRMGSYCFIEITNQSVRPINGLEVLLGQEMLIEIEKEDDTHILTFANDRLEIGKLRVDETIVMRIWSNGVPFDGIKCVYEGGRHVILKPTLDFGRTLVEGAFLGLGLIGFIFMLGATLEKIGRMLDQRKEGSTEQAIDDE